MTIIGKYYIIQLNYQVIVLCKLKVKFRVKGNHMIATIIIYSFIVLGTAGGFASGFDVQVRKMGSGLKSMLITAVIVSVFGASILSTPVVSAIFDDFRNTLSDSFFAKDAMFSIISYIILFFVTLLLLKISTATIGAFTTTQDNEADWLNKGLGGVLAFAMCVVFVMLVIWIMYLLPSGQDAIGQIRDSAANIFLNNNLFLSIFGR